MQQNETIPDVDVHELREDGEEDGVACRQRPRAPVALALRDRVEAVLRVDRHLAVALVVLLGTADVVLLTLRALELVAGGAQVLPGFSSAALKKIKIEKFCSKN